MAANPKLKAPWGEYVPYLGPMTASPRIVSLLASATEIVAALGALDQLVGRSHECDWPPEVAHLPALSHPVIDIDASSAAIDAQVKARSNAAQTCPPDALAALSLYNIDVDLLRDLRPDVILTQTQCDVCAVSERDVVAALQRTTGLSPQIVALAPHRLADLWSDIRRVGAALSREVLACDLVVGLQVRLAALPAPVGPPPRVAVLEWLDPLMGAGNWMPELIAAAGGDPCFGAAGEHSPWITWEDLAAADPDILVLTPCGFTLERALQDLPIVQRHPAWGQLRAVRAGQVYLADGNAYFNRSGPRLVDTAEILASIIQGGDAHPDGWMIC